MIDSSVTDFQTIRAAAFDQLRQFEHVGPVDQADAAECAAVGVLKSCAGIQVDPQHSATGGEGGLDTDPDRTKFGVVAVG